MTTINTNTTATTAFVVTPDTDGTFVVNTGSGVGAERMRITSTGAVGFGTSTPTWDLELKGVGDTYIGVTALASGTGTDDDAGIVIRAAQTGEASIYFRQDDGDVTESVIFRNGGANDLRFQTNGTTQMILNASGDLQFNSGYGSAATAYGCRAWVNFNGTGAVAIRDSGNVTTVTDLGVGVYRVNFTNAMPDANYATCVTVSNDTAQVAPRTGGVNFGTNGGAPTTALVYIVTGVSGTTANDLPYVNVTVFR